MKTINATIVQHGHETHVFAYGETNFFGKFHGGITVGSIDKNHKTVFTNSMGELTQLNEKVTATLQELRRNRTGIDWLAGPNHAKIKELSDMQRLFVQIFVNDECFLATSPASRPVKVGPQVAPKPTPQAIAAARASVAVSQLYQTLNHYESLDF